MIHGGDAYSGTVATCDIEPSFLITAGGFSRTSRVFSRAGVTLWAGVPTEIDRLSGIV